MAARPERGYKLRSGSPQEGIESQVSQNPERPSTVLRRLGRNLKILLSGSAITALLGLATLALNTRALGPMDFGVLVLLQAYVVLLGRIFSFDTWQAIIRFGAASTAGGDSRRLLAIGNLAMVLDIASACAAGIAGLAFLLLLPGTVGLSAAYLPAAAAYTASLFLLWPGAPTGLLRLFDRFTWLTAIAVGESASRFLVSAILFAADATIAAYLLAFAAIMVASSLVRTFLAIRELRAATGGLRLPARGELSGVAPDFIRFSAGSWITGTLNVTRREGTVLVVAALLGPPAAGLYGLALRIVRPIHDVAEIVRQALFPELSKLVAEGDRQSVAHVVRRILLFTVPIGAAAAATGIALGNFLVMAVAGPAYAEAYWPFVWLVAAAGLYFCMPLLSSVVILHAGMRVYTLGALGAAAIWALLFIWPMLTWGVGGAGVGELVYVVAWVGINLALLSRTGLMSMRGPRG